ncbi:MAG: PKD domain-containing protein, partial [Bacteroidia bacterium]
MFQKVFTLLFILVSTSSIGSHIVGGEIYYNYLENDDYRVFLNLYIDCQTGNPAAIAQDGKANIGIYRNSDNKLLRTIEVSKHKDQLLKKLNYNCLDTPSNICVQKFEFKTKLNLPDIPEGYTLVFQRCCRNRTIVNIANPGSTGASYFVKIPERKIYGNNSSPKFKRLPPNFLCLHKPFRFNHEAVDPDGDSLSYHLVIPFDGATVNDPRPRNPSKPPYNPVRLYAPFDSNNLITSNPRLSIDSVTGFIRGIPRRLGQYSMGIVVKEWRNGKLLSSVIRDYQFNVVGCSFDLISTFFTPEQECDLDLSFENLSKGATTFNWDFGIDNIKSDTSTKENPTFTYPKTGTYVITLVASNPTCSDTFYKTINVNPDTGAFAGPDVRSCNGEAVAIGPPKYSKNAKYNWTPGFLVSDSTRRNPTVSPTKNERLVLTQTFGYCWGTDTVNVLFGPPEIGFKLDTIDECHGRAFMLNSTGEGDSITWRIRHNNGFKFKKGVRTYFEFNEDKEIDVTLIAGINKSCSDSLTKDYSIKLDTLDFAGEDAEICFGDSIWIGERIKASGVEYRWSPIETFDDSTVSGGYFSPKKHRIISLTKKSIYCELTDSISLRVDKPSPSFRTAYSAPCDGKSVKFFNNSVNCKNVTWNFGRGVLDTVSQKDSVIITYKENSDFLVSLTGVSSKGCKWLYERSLNVFADTAEFAGPDSNLCLGQALEIGLKDSTSFAKFRWIPANEVSDATISNPTITPNDSSVYILRKVYPECTFSDTILVGVHDPIADFSTDYDPHCDVFDIALANENLQYDRILWDFGHEAFEDVSDTVRSIFPGPGTYQIRVFAFKEQCGDTVSRTVTAFLDTGVTIIPDSVICTGDEIVLGIVDTTTSAKHLWTPAVGLNNDTISNPSAKPTTTTIYTYQRIFSKCTYTGEITVRVAEPVASFDTTVLPDCFGFNAEFINTSTGAEKYEWAFSNNDSSTNESETQIFEYGSEL